MIPAITTFPADEAQCVLACLAGTCTEPRQQQLHSASVVFDYTQYKAQNGGGENQAHEACDLRDTLSTLAAAHRSGATAAVNLNWLALAQTILSFIQALLAGVNPPSPAGV